MSLRSDATLEAFAKRIMYNKEIMDIMKLPVLKNTDSEDLIAEKREVLIDKFITKTAQIPSPLEREYEPKTIDGIEYKEYGKIRIALSFAQSVKLNHDLFGKPQIDMIIYYDNTEIANIYKLLDLLSDEFSGQDLKLELDDGKSFIRNIRCEGQISQTAIINNYERLGLRFSFYATLYKN